MKKRVVLLIFPFFLVGSWIILTRPDLVVQAAHYLAESANEVKANIATVAAVVSVLMYAKLRFWNTRLYRKIERTYGQSQYIKALEVTTAILKFITPEQLIARILAMDATDIHMKRALLEIRAIFDLKELDLKHTLTLSRTENRYVKHKIKTLIEVINKQFEVHYMSKDLKRDKFPTRLAKVREKRLRADEADKQIQEKGKTKLVPK